MDKRIISGVEVTVIGEISNSEIVAYLKQLQSENKFKIITANVTVDGGFVDVKFENDEIMYFHLTGFGISNTFDKRDCCIRTYVGRDLMHVIKLSEKISYEFFENHCKKSFLKIINTMNIN